MIALPFRGEFGWLVAMWVPWLRHLCRRVYTGGDFIVLCRPGESELFRDFASKVIEIDAAPEVNRVDCANCFVTGHGRWRGEDEIRFLRPRFADLGWKLPTKRDSIAPEDLPFRWPPDAPPRPVRAEHIRFCESIETDLRWIAVHARACLLKQPDRNWPIERWNALVERLLDDFDKVFAIGTKADAAVPDGAVDIRGMTIGGLMSDLSACSMLVGPSSGPHALALQCATPIVWWSGNKKDVERYESAWNPFKIQNERAGVDWQPSVDAVRGSTRQIVLRRQRQSQL